MVILSNLIELKTNTLTERVIFKGRYLVQDSFTFELQVFSKGFSGISHFCLSSDRIEIFCTDLKKMHFQLAGKTILNDSDSDGFVQFEIDTNGGLIVTGQVGGSHEDHFMHFVFCTDQTCIPPLIDDFKSLLMDK
ncbi:hypothetical protein [Algoriphagus namhaensis]